MLQKIKYKRMQEWRKGGTEKYKRGCPRCTPALCTRLGDWPGSAGGAGLLQRWVRQAAPRSWASATLVFLSRYWSRCSCVHCEHVTGPVLHVERPRVGDRQRKAPSL